MYRELIEQSIGKVYQAGVATKILQYMGKIRNESDITQARRWVMELLQNARDLAFPDRPVDVQFILEKDSLTFRHNGKPFRVKDILSIINQVSSKNPGEGVGQFGTGFMTTYQLSEKVEIHSVLQEEGCPGREFRITLDRSGNTKEEILHAIEQSLQELLQADEGPEYEKNGQGTGYDTEFCYRLENENGRRIARTGMTDLADTILYIMLFSEKLGSVELRYRLPERQQDILYRRGELLQCPDGTGQLTLLESGNPGDLKRHILMSIEEAGLTLAAEYDEKQGFLPISERTPRLFVDFPLIGAEPFPFPVVLNHLELHPNEPRNGISLVDNSDSMDAANNKEIMRQAVALYARFVKALLEKDSRGIEELLRISRQQENKEWSESWVRKYLYQDIYQIVRELPVLPVGPGRIPLADPECYLIQSADSEETDRIRRLTAPLRRYQVPGGNVDWYGVFGAYEVEEGKVISLEQILEKAEKHLRQDLDEGKMDALEWCNLLYQSCMQNSDTDVRIRSGDVALFPNQNKEDWRERRLFTILEVCRDPGIPEILKDVAERLAILDNVNQNPADLGIRRKLLHSGFLPEKESGMAEYELTKLTEYIFVRSSRGYRVQSFTYYSQQYLEAWRGAWYLMLSCGPDDELYLLCRMVWGDSLPERQRIEDARLHTSLWSNSYRSLLSELSDWLEAQQERDMLQGTMSGPENETLYWWLNCCYDRLNHYFHNNEFWYRKVLLNQKGQLKCPAELKEDQVREKELKGIAACFQVLDQDCDVYAGLLDEYVSLNGWNLPVMRDGDVTARINRVLQKLLSEINLSQADIKCQEACTQLLGWIQEHPDLAKDAFPNFYKEEDQMKLLTPGAAVSLHRKAKSLDYLYTELGAADPVQLVELVKRAQSMESGKHTGELWAEEELSGLSEKERANVCREIGQAGEEYAYSRIRDYFLAEGYEIQSEEAGKMLLSAADDRATGQKAEVIRPDRENYHQAGWDIRVALTTPSRDVTEEYYLEIKTHTPGSVARGILSLSNEQMRIAAEQRERYVLLSVVYDYKERKVRRMDAYRNLIRCIADGRMYNAEGNYLLQCRGQI